MVQADQQLTARGGVTLRAIAKDQSLTPPVTDALIAARHVALLAAWPRPQLCNDRDDTDFVGSLLRDAPAASTSENSRLDEIDLAIELFAESC